MFPTLLACAAVQSYPQAQPGSADSASPEAVRSAEGPVVIIGGGPSGMAAAMDLEGAVLFEGSDRLGGRAPGIGQLMYFVGTEEQRQHGVEDSIEQALEDWPLYTGSAPTQATEDFLRGSHEVRDRLVDLGLSFSLSPPDEPLRRQRNHGALAPGLPATLEAALPADLDLRLETRVEDLWIEDGQVLGVLTQDGPQPANNKAARQGNRATADFSKRLATDPIRSTRSTWGQRSHRPGLLHRPRPRCAGPPASAACRPARPAPPGHHRLGVARSARPGHGKPRP